MGRSWTEIQAEIAETDQITGALAALHWDQQCYLPKGAAPLRGNQIAALAKITHNRMTDPALGDDLRALLSTDLTGSDRVAITKLIEDFERSSKLSGDFVSRFAKAQASGFAAWMEAKEAGDFSKFSTQLTELLALSRERAEQIDPNTHPLQVLMSEFDPGVQIDDLKHTFKRLQVGLTELIQATQDSPPRALGGSWPIPQQRALHNQLITNLGYDLNHGRLDFAEHPFTIALGHTDVRITTHLYEDDLLSGLGGTIHETGHALYEQGLPHLEGTGLDQAASFGLHESQSRFWENAIGRSLPFFEWLAPQLHEYFPGNGKSPTDLYRAANRIKPGLIRVKADEVTYNLHVIIRVELELALFEDRLSISDLPDAWNELYQKYLGVCPQSPSEGVLQDVHWSSGSFAYFQSYTLGNLYAASFHQTLRAQTPDLDEQVRRGEFGGILSWLRENVHQYGRLSTGEERVRTVVGERDSVEDLLSYLWARHGALYGVQRP